MLKRVFAATALAALVASPVLAQSSAPATSTTQPSASAPSGAAMPSPAGSTSRDTAFLNDQSASDWRASKLIGTNVYGPDNAKIGDVSEVLLDSSGAAHAVVIGVGGFLGVGQKDVAVPFTALTVTPTANGDKIDKVTVKYTKADLENAPAFKYKQSTTASTAPSSPGSMQR